MLVGRCSVGSGRAVLVDESVAGGVSSDRSAGPVLDDFAVVRCALVERAVRPVRVVVLDVVAQEQFGVALVPDEGPVEELASHGADPAFGVGIRDACVRQRSDDRRAVAADTLSNGPANWAAPPSWIKNRIPWLVRIVRLRAACAVHARFGLVVVPARCTRRVSTSTKNKT